MSDPLKFSMFVAQWLTSFAFRLNWLLFTMSSMSPNLRCVSKYPRKSLRHVPLRLNPIYRTSNNLFESWIRCTKSYGIITPRKKRLGKQSLIFNGISQTSFKPIPKSNHSILFKLRNLGTRFFLRGEGCNIQVVRQWDTKFGCIICMHDMVYIRCTKH
jgi:hypothetical protein